MDPVLIFLAEIAASLVLSTLILVRLQHLLRRIGDETCRNGGATTEFWLAYTQLMMLITPVLIISWFSGTGHRYYSAIDQLQGSLSIVLVGQVGGLAIVGRAVWKALVPNPVATPAPSTPKWGPSPSPLKAEAA
jgi:hypothetical protein